MGEEGWMERRGRHQVRREEHDLAVAELRPPRDGRRDGRELCEHGEEVGVGKMERRRYLENPRLMLL